MYEYYKADPTAPIYYDIETVESFLADEQDLRANVRGQVYKVAESENESDPDILSSADDLPWDDAEAVVPSSTVLAERAVITQIQFASLGSAVTDWAVTYQWCPEIAYWTQQIFSLPNLRVNWNNRIFDDPILRYSGISLTDNRLDLMDLWHRYEPDLPKGLGFVTPYFWPTVTPWKHLSQSEPGTYGCKDVIALQKIHPALVRACEKDQIWTSFQVHDMQLGPALDRMSARGYPCDEKRKSRFGAVLERYLRILRTRMEKSYPEALLPYDKASSYREKPTKLKQAYDEDSLYQVEMEVPEELSTFAVRSRKGMVPPPEVVELVGKPFDPTIHPKWLKEQVVKTGRTVKELRWVYRKNFNPNSRDQILAYLESKRQQEWDEFKGKDLSFGAVNPTLVTPPDPSVSEFKAPRGYKTNHVWYIPTNPKEKKFKPWVSAKGLTRLVAKLKAYDKPDTFLPLVIKAAQHARMKSAFVDTWKPVDNKVHTTFKFSPATPQLAAVQPNILAAPKHGALAKRWTRCLRRDEAEPHQWVSMDYGGFHAITTGFLAKDPSYIRAARIDIHGILGYIAEKLPNWDTLRRGLIDASIMDDAEITQMVKVWARENGPIKDGTTFKERRDKAYKATILGVQLGRGPYSMYMAEPEVWGDKRFAAEMIEIEKGIWPKVFAYQDDMRRLGSTPPYYIRNDYGYLRRFTDVFRKEWDDERKQWVEKHGADSEKAIATDVQAIAFGHIRDGLIWYDKTVCPETGKTYADKFGLCNNIHDDFKFWCPTKYTEECVAVGEKVLQRRNMILKNEIEPLGLWCGIEISVGKVGEGQDTCKDIKIPPRPMDFPIEHLVGWAGYQQTEGGVYVPAA